MDVINVSLQMEKTHVSMGVDLALDPYGSSSIVFTCRQHTHLSTGSVVAAPRDVVHDDVAADAVDDGVHQCEPVSFPRRHWTNLLPCDELACKTVVATRAWFVTEVGNPTPTRPMLYVCRSTVDWGWLGSRVSR